MFKKRRDSAEADAGVPESTETPGEEAGAVTTGVDHPFVTDPGLPPSVTVTKTPHTVATATEVEPVDHTERAAGVEPAGRDVEPDVPPAHEPVAPTGRPVERTRFGGAYVALIVAAVVLLLLLIFILQNSDSVKISFFSLHGSLPLGVALLLSAIAGVLLVAIPSVGRIVQLRKATRKAAAAPAIDPSGRRGRRARKNAVD